MTFYRYIEQSNDQTAINCDIYCFFPAPVASGMPLLSGDPIWGGTPVHQGPPHLLGMPQEPKQLSHLPRGLQQAIGD